MKLYSQTKLPTKHGSFKLHVFSKDSGDEISVLSLGDLNNTKEPLFARIHSQCLTGEVFGSLKCDCSLQLDAALKEMQLIGKGILIYLNQEGRGIGLGNKVKAYSLQDENGLDTVDANLELGFDVDLRTYEDAVSIFEFFNIKNIALNSNNPLKLQALKEAGFSVTRKPLNVDAYAESEGYLKTKVNKCGHLV